MSLQWKDGSGRRTETYRPGQATPKPDPSFGTPYGQPLGDAVSFGGDWNEWRQKREQPPQEPPAPEQQPYQQVPMSHWWQGQAANPYGGYYFNQPAQFPYWGGWWSNGQ